MCLSRYRLEQGGATTTGFPKDHQQLSTPNQPLKIAQDLNLCLASAGDLVEQADHFEYNVGKCSGSNQSDFRRYNPTARDNILLIIR